MAKLGRRDSKLELWDRIRDYKFGDLVPPHLSDKVRAMFGGPDASTRAFGDKVARKLNWKIDFALRAISEYRRFVYLGVISEFYVTPPKIIDRVWHEHLLFTRGYRDFCRHVLKTDFDHAPELVPTPDQTSVFQAQYDATLELYAKEFNAIPPADIWGVTKSDGRRPGGVEPPRKAEREEDDWDDIGVPLYTLWGDSPRRHDDGGWDSFVGADGGTDGHAHHSHHSHHGHDSHTAHDGHSHGSDLSGFDSHGHSGGSGGGGDGGGGDGGDGGGGDGGGGGCSSGCGGGGCGGGGD